jgi:hypothetical protein
MSLETTEPYFRFSFGFGFGFGSGFGFIHLVGSDLVSFSLD